MQGHIKELFENLGLSYKEFFEKYKEQYYFNNEQIRCFDVKFISDFILLNYTKNNATPNK